MLRGFIVIAFLFSTALAEALTVRTVIPDNWENPNTWSNHQVPGSPDTIIVQHYITFNQALTIQAPTVLVVDSTGTLCGDYEFDVSCGAKLFNYGRVWVNSSHMMDAWNYNEFYAKNSISISACSLPGYNTGYHNVPPNGHTSVWPPVLCRTHDTGWYGPVDAVNELEKMQVLIYPNPVSNGILKVHAPGPVKLILADVLGNETGLRATGTGDTELDIHSCVQGLYFLQIESGGKRMILKIIKTD